MANVTHFARKRKPKPVETAPEPAPEPLNKVRGDKKSNEDGRLDRVIAVIREKEGE